MHRISVANAPCSYGAFEMTIGVDDANVPAPDVVLDAVAGAGYEGIDLGPMGWLGTGEVLRQALESRRLVLAGGFLELPFTDPPALEAALDGVDRLLDVFDAVRMLADGGFPPVPTLADAGDASRRARAGRAHLDRSLGLDEAGWRRLAAGVDLVLGHCRERGYEAAFHHHANSFVEAPWEIDRLLELSDARLCLDTGHLLVGGGDPIDALERWGARVSHVHLKDCRTDIVEAVTDADRHGDDIWYEHAFCRLGEGALDLHGFLDRLLAQGYTGWLVVEQDWINAPQWPLTRAVSDQQANRRFLAAAGI